MTRTKVAILHNQLGFGGSEVSALWAIEALKRSYDVTLITGGKVDLDLLNQYYGTHLASEEFSVREVQMPFGLHRTPKFAALRGAFFHRYVQRIAHEFDVMFSAYNPCDFGVRGVQYVADFTFVKEWRETLDPSLQHYRRWLYADSPLRRAYLALCDYVSKPDPEAWKQNVTIAVSNWTGDLLRREFGVEARTLRLPVAVNFPTIPWEGRENGFVCIGRVVPEKRMDAAIRILERVRQQGHDVHLHILGALDDSPWGEKLKALAARHERWVFLEGRTFGQKKRELIAGHRYGIHTRDNDAGPVAVAEMVKAGCITFVPSSGGQTEMADAPMLGFSDEEDAARKIGAVLSNVELQGSLRQHLAQQSSKFSVEDFQSGVSEIIFDFVSHEQGSLLPI